MNRTSLRQRGAALILLLAIIVMGAGWFMVRRLDAIAGDFTAQNRAYNAKVLARAKQALIGYVAAQAAKAFEDNPGALPCPEAPGYFNSGTGNDGKTASSCTLPAVGRFPWRTIGTDKLIDAAGEPLWYVVSTGWAYNGSNTTINSNSVGQLSVDGSAGSDADTVVALIIAPGPPINVSASTGCTAWSQTRPASGPPDLRNYLECENATSPADVTFVTTQTNASFNDQVVRITKADIMPGIEAAIAHRTEREVVTPLKTALASPFSGANLIYPFAAPFADPSSQYAMQGAPATYRGLLPLNYAETAAASGTACTPGAGAPRCNPTFVAWSGTPTLSGALLSSTNCSATTPAQVSCTFNYWCILPCAVGMTTTTAFTLNATAAYLGMALRQFNTAVAMTNVDTAGRSASATLDPTGSGSIALSGNTAVPNNGSLLANALCGIGWPFSLFFGCMQGNIAVPVLLLADHPFLHSDTDPTYGWFLRNKWHEVSYYAVATGYAPSVLPAAPSCASGCLSTTNVLPAGQERALLILAGRSINGTARPNGTTANYVEFGNATGAFERQPVSSAVNASLKKPFNDRVVVLDCSNPNAAYTLPCDNR